MKLNKSEIEKKIDTIQELRLKQAELLVQLKVSLEIESMWPDAFKNGTCSTSVGGNFDKLDQMYLVLDNNEELKRFPIADVNPVLGLRELNRFYDSLQDKERRIHFNNRVINLYKLKWADWTKVNENKN